MPRGKCSTAPGGPGSEDSFFRGLGIGICEQHIYADNKCTQNSEPTSKGRPDVI